MGSETDELRTRVSGLWVLKAVKKKSRLISGYWTTISKDREGESFDPTWFAAAISPGGNYYNNPVLLYNHDADEVIGHGEVESFQIDPIGVYGDFIVTSDERWKQIEDGDLRAFSWFGYVDYINKTIDLIEVTVTPVPVNPDALFEIKKKALDLGLCTGEDFPGAKEEMVPEETKKAVHLGKYFEHEMTMAAVSRACNEMQWTLGSMLADSQTPVADRTTKAKAMLDEFGMLAHKVICAIMPNQEASAVAIKQIQELWPAPESPLNDGGSVNKGEEMDRTEVETIVKETIAPLQQSQGEITTALKSLLERLPASAPQPAAQPAAQPPVAATEPEAETKGDAAAVKGITLDDAGIEKLAASIVSKAITPGRANSVVEDVKPGEERSDQKTAKIKSLVERVKKTAYHGPGVEHEWQQHTRDALALEMAGRTFDEMPGGEDE